MAGNLQVEELKALLEKAPRKKLENFLFSLASTYRNIWDLTVVEFAQPEDDDLYSQIMEQIETLIDHYTESSELIQIANQASFVRDFQVILKTGIDGIIKDHLCDQLLELFDFLLDEIDEFPVEKPEQISKPILDTAFFKAKEMEKTLNEDEHREFFEWIQRWIDSNPLYLDWLLNWYFAGFQEPYQLRRKLKYIDSVFKNEIACRSTRDLPSERQKLVDVLKPEDNISQWIEQSNELAILVDYSKDLTNQGKIDEAIKLLENSLSQQRIGDEFKTKAIRTLLDLYALQENSEAYLDLGKNYILIYRKPDVEVADYLETYSSDEEWKDLLPSVLEVIKYSTQFDDYCLKHDLLEYLVNHLLNHRTPPSDSSMEKYELYLSQSYPMEYAELWLKKAEKEAAVASKRSQYIKVAQALERAAQYEEAREEALEKARILKKTYARKRAFIDELVKRGF